MLLLAHVIEVVQLLRPVELKHQGGGDATIVNISTSAWMSLELQKSFQSEEYI